MNNEIFTLINSQAGDNNYLDGVMVFSAHYLIYILFAAAASCIVYLMVKKQWKEIALFFITLALAFGLSLIAAKLFISDRPFVDNSVTQLIPHAANQSFPSDHTTAAIAIALATIAFTRFKKTGWLFLATALLIGFSRIFTGVHYPFDIAGGIAVGFIATVVVSFVLRRFDKTKSPVVTTDD